MERPRLVATVTASTTEELRTRRDEAAGVSDLVELRLDAVHHPDVQGALSGRRGPVIVTCRPTREGGAFQGAELDRLALLEQAAHLGADYIDLEWDADAPRLRSRGRGLILSAHDFDGVPTDLESRYAAMRASGAEVVKIAVTARGLRDTARLLELGRREGAHAPAVFIAMGTPGLISRILPSHFGSCWSYAGDAAPGQLPARRLLREFRFRHLTGRARVYALLGRPVTHSLSPAIHNAAFSALGLDAVYVPLDAGEVEEFWTLARALPLAGASVTAPHKVSAIAGLDEVDPIVEAVGAVNTIKADGSRWLGRNTDVAGFLAPLAGVQLEGLRASVLGAGGAARAVAVALRREGADVTIHARDSGRGSALAAGLSVRFGPPTPDTGSWDILVNASPVGTWPDTRSSPLEATHLNGGSLVYDLVYNPSATRLMQEARAAGLRTIGGLEMLLAQAERQFEWWTGLAAPRDAMRLAAEARLEEMAGIA
jgi:3-dehydroquinate dehydratase/shikimate dehydrogenase